MKFDLTINTDVAHQILTNFIRSEVSRVGFSRAVINLSGGLDSALSCMLAAEALGPENVLALRLPYQTSSADSLEHAQLIIDQLHIPSITIEITEMVEPFFARDPEISKQRKGNIMARQRMIALYDQSEIFKGLPIGTSNKTEILLGYTTMWGDMASALNPIGDLYKTQVRQLSRALNIPAPIIDKPPSRSEEHTSELQSQFHLVCRLLLEKKKTQLNALLSETTTNKSSNTPASYIHESSSPAHRTINQTFQPILNRPHLAAPSIFYFVYFH